MLDPEARLLSDTELWQIKVLVERGTHLVDAQEMSRLLGALVRLWHHCAALTTCRATAEAERDGYREVTRVAYRDIRELVSAIDERDPVARRLRSTLRIMARVGVPLPGWNGEYPERQQQDRLVCARCAYHWLGPEPADDEIVACPRCGVQAGVPVWPERQGAT